MTDYKPVKTLNSQDIKIQEKSQILFCKLLKNKWKHAKALPKRFHLNSHTVGFRQQNQKSELYYMYLHSYYIFQTGIYIYMYAVNFLTVDTPVRWTSIYEFHLLVCNVTLYKVDTFLRQAARVGPEGDGLRVYCIHKFNKITSNKLNPV